MVAAPVFTQDGTLDLFWLGGATAIAYLPSAKAGFSGQITLAQAWGDTEGVYLFLDARPEHVAQTLPEIQGFIARLGFPGALRMVWLQTQGLAPDGWRAWAIQLAPAAGPIANLGQPTALDFTPFGLRIGQGTTIQAADEAAGWGFSLTPPQGAPCLWLGDGGDLPVAGGVNIPFVGTAAGCFTFQLPVPKFEVFGADVSFFFDSTVEVAPQSSDQPPSRQRTGYVERLRLPLLSGPLAGSLAVRLDPTQPLAVDRSAMVFPTGSSSQPIPSALASPRGHPIALSALPGAGTAPGARLVFQKAPIYADPTSDQHYLHLVPDGAFSISVSAPPAVTKASIEAVQAGPPWTPAERLVCGMSGVEYVGLPAADNCRLVFEAGHPGYAPGAAQGVAAPEAAPPLTVVAPGLGTTAWARVLPPSGAADVINYFSQAEQAPLYGAFTASPPAGPTQAGGRTPAAAGAQSFLVFTELPSAQVGAGDAGITFPIAPYRALKPEAARDAERVETSGIAPARRAAINPPQNVEETLTSAPTRSVTPQGLLVEWDYADPMVWTDVVIGNDVDPVANTANLLQFTGVKGQLRTALQTNRLFLAAACPGAFYNGGSVRYQPRADTFAGLLAAAPGDPTFTAAAAWYAANNYPVSADEDAFKATLNSIPGVTVDPAHFAALRRVSGLLRAEISGWKFQFSPWSWVDGTDDACSANSPGPGTIVLLKFAPGKLSDLIADTLVWTWPAAASFGGSPNAVRDKVVALIADARKRRETMSAGGATTPYDHFLDEVVDNPDWSGVLALGCPIPLTELPGPLQCLAAGIDPSRFAAHHVGLNATAFKVGAKGIELSQTSMFGLIDYQDTKDLHLDPSPDAGFAYKVQSLTIEFVNSAIRGFSSRVELLAPHLFGSTITMRDPQRGNSLLMDGVFQKPPNATSDAEGTYVFKLVGQGLFDVSDSVLSTIEIDSAEFSTLAPADTKDPNAVVSAQFRLGGRLAFQQLSAFDVFSYGPATDGGDPLSGLNFRNLLINMSFPLYHAQTPPTFSEEADKLTADQASPPRTQSLVNRFPVRLAGLTGSPKAGGPAPADLGYSAADTPLENSRLEAPWWGVIYDIDLGTTGALSSGSALTLSVLAAWAGKGLRDDAAPIYVGVRLPGLRDLVGASLPFESFLRLGFRNIKFSAYDTDKGRAYILRFRRFSISALGLSFPPGNIDVVLFGNPSGDKTKVGWYAAYAAEEDKKKQQLASPERLRLAARRGRFGRF